jgi:hypothetical protein
MEHRHEQILSDKARERDNLDKNYSCNVQALNNTHKRDKAILRKANEKAKKRATLLQKVLHELIIGGERELCSVAFECRNGYETERERERIKKDEAWKLQQKKWAVNRIVCDLRLKKEYFEVLRAENQSLKKRINELANLAAGKRRPLWTSVRN